MKEEIHLTNDLGQLQRLSAFVARTATRWGLEEKTVMRLNLALEEAVANIIMYAYPGENDKEIRVGIEKKGGRLTVTLVDWGVAFDPTAKEQPDLTQPADQRPIGGLGIHLIREIMTTVAYRRRDDENELTLIMDLY